MKVHVRSKDGISDAAQIELENGAPLENVTSMTLMLVPRQMIIAQCTFMMPNMDVIGEVTVQEDHLRELAAAHGYNLVRKSD